MRGIRRSPVNSPRKGQWRGALIFSFISVWINGWENNGEAGDLTRYRVHYDVIVMLKFDKHRDRSAEEMPVKFRIDKIIITSNFAASKLHEIRQ